MISSLILFWASFALLLSVFWLNDTTLWIFQTRSRLPEKNNKRKAEQMLKDILAQYEDKGTLITSKTLFSDFINEWLEVAETTVRSNTYDIYRLNTQTHVIPYYQKLNISLQDLQPIHIQKYFTSKIKGTKGRKGLSSNTVAKQKTVISETLKYALK